MAVAPQVASSLSMDALCWKPRRGATDLRRLAKSGDELQENPDDPGARREELRAAALAQMRQGLFDLIDQHQAELARLERGPARDRWP
jgi:hypothetical protein